MTTAGVHVHRAERADVLADALAEVLARPPADPFAAEVVAVPAKGVERWLAQRLSHRLGAPDGDGICAGVAFRSPAALVTESISGAIGGAPDADPWHPERAVWPLLEVLDAAAEEPWCAVLHAHHARRHALARRMAELFGAYATHRPELLRAWRAGECGVDADLAWQPELWRRLRARIGGPDPTERVDAACAALRADPAVVALPERLSLFGPTRLAAQELAVLAALGEHRAVHLWLPHPSPALWATVASYPASGAVPPRATDPSADAAAHPLLSSLGRDVRELQVRLTAAVPGLVDEHHPCPEPPPTLLGRLQRGLRDDRLLVMTDADRSVQVHACHGPDRQVEVLREVVLSLLEADPGLEPRDVLVMCPDIETFAPLISAAFGPGAHPAQALPVRLADRALRQVNPLLDVVARLLELATARLTAAQVLDLLAAAPVRRRFGLDDGDLDRLRELAVGSGVRWGLDAAHRRPFKLEAFGQNTWSAGLDRLLLGVAMPGDAWLGTALPAVVEPGDTVRVGRLAEFVERLAGVLGELSGERPLAEWTATLTRALELLTSAPRGVAGRFRRGPSSPRPRTSRARTQPRCRWASPMSAACSPSGCAAVPPARASAPARSPSPRSCRCARCRTASSACSGSTTACSRARARSTATTCWPAARSSASATPAAKTASSCSTRSWRPPTRSSSSTPGPTSAPAYRAHPRCRWASCSTRCAPADVVAAHPLQPFDARNFTTPFSFDRAELAGARAAAGPRAAPPPFLPAPLPRPAPGTVLLDDLVAFVEHPAKGFLTQRVGLSMYAGDEAPADALPVAPDGLAKWAIGHRLLGDRLAGRDARPLPAGRVAPRRPAAGRAGRSAARRRAGGRRAAGGGGRRVPGRRGHRPGRRRGAARRHPRRRHGRRAARAHRPARRVLPAHPEAADAVVGAAGGAHRGHRRAVAGGHGRAGRAVRHRQGHRRAGAAGRGPRGAGRAGGAAGGGAVRAAAAVHGHRPQLRPGPARRGGTRPTRWPKPLGRGRTAQAPSAPTPSHERVWGRAAPASVLSGEAGPPGGEPTRFGALALGLWSPLLQVEDVVRR